MPIAQSARIHPTAIVSAEADVGEDVQVGPFVIVEGAVCIGAGCEIRPGAHLIGPLTLGCRNSIFDGVVLGEQPQHLRYAGEPTRLVIGDDNIIREHVTIHRGTSHSWETRIGNHNFLMANCHIAHDCKIGDHCIFANGALLGGHCIVEDNVYLSGNSAVHQFVRVGRLALLSGVSAATKDIPPFIIQHRFNRVVGVNVIGMRRAGIPSASIEAVRRVFHLLYRSGLLLPTSLAQIERDLGHVAEVADIVAFIRSSSRGITLHLDREAA